jgi:hypothetical protein
MILLIATYLRPTPTQYQTFTNLDVYHEP